MYVCIQISKITIYVVIFVWSLYLLHFPFFLSCICFFLFGFFLLVSVVAAFCRCSFFPSSVFLHVCVSSVSHHFYIYSIWLLSATTVFTSVCKYTICRYIIISEWDVQPYNILLLFSLILQTISHFHPFIYQSPNSH